MPVFELTLTQFHFPEKLSNDKANFRFLVDLRFINGKGQFTTEHAVMPSLDTFWECDTSRDEKPNYVRLKTNGGVQDQFDMAAIDDWDKLIFCVKGESVHSFQFKVIDVNREDAWALSAMTPPVPTRFSIRKKRSCADRSSVRLSVRQLFGGDDGSDFSDPAYSASAADRKAPFLSMASLDVGAVSSDRIGPHFSCRSTPTPRTVQSLQATPSRRGGLPIRPRSALRASRR